MLYVCLCWRLTVTGDYLACALAGLVDREATVRAKATTCLAELLASEQPDMSHLISQMVEMFSAR